MNIIVGKRVWSVLAMAGVCAAYTLCISAQVKTKTTTAVGKAAVVIKVERGEVVTVSGNDLVVKMADGSIRHFDNVPENARVTVDGKQLGIQDLKPGMKLERTITTTKTPQTVTTIQSITGKVWAITPPLSVILTLEDGKNQQFKIPEDQKFNVDGQMLDAWGLRKGMTITATKIVEVSDVDVKVKKRVTGEPAPVVSADAPILVAEGEEGPVPAPAEPMPVAAPAASPVSTWRIWLIAFLVLAIFIVWNTVRKKRPRT